MGVWVGTILCVCGRGGRAIVLPRALALAAALAKCVSFYVKYFYVMGKVLSGRLSCLCDRSCCLPP